LPLLLIIRAFHAIVAVVALFLTPRNNLDGISIPRAISNCDPGFSGHHHSAQKHWRLWLASPTGFEPVLPP
jgi:hypothetical protein